MPISADQWERLRLALFVIALVLGLFPVFAFPMVLVAGVMTLAAERTGNEPWLLMWVVRTFIIGSLLYPFAYCAMAASALVVRFYARHKSAALTLSLLPIGYLLLLGMLLIVWMVLGV